MAFNSRPNTPEEIERYLRDCIKDMVQTITLFNKTARSPNKRVLARLVDQYSQELPDLPIVTKWVWDHYGHSPKQVTVKHVRDGHYQAVDGSHNYWDELYDTAEEAYEHRILLERNTIKSSQQALGTLIKSRDKFFDTKNTN